jgi:hypothetical protein
MGIRIEQFGFPLTLSDFGETISAGTEYFAAVWEAGESKSTAHICPFPAMGIV